MPRTSKHINRAKPVAYLQADGNYTTLYYPDGTTVFTSSTLKKVSSWYPDMIRINKNLAISPAYVVGYDRHSAKRLTVHLKFANTHITFEASRRYIASFEEAMIAYE
jgi:DNA-binding LytR/AlgR family response regulator